MLNLLITIIAHFWSKNADISRTTGICQVIYTFSESALGNVSLCQVS